MASTIFEFYGARPGTSQSLENARKAHCPFIDGKCKKKNGACSLLLTTATEPVIICPNRLYGGHFDVIRDVAKQALGGRDDLISPKEAIKQFKQGNFDPRSVIVFGQGFGKELAVSAPAKDGERGSSFSVDYVLCALSESFQVEEFAAIEVQTIDTTNSYASAAKYYRTLTGNARVDEAKEVTKAGLNWENVNKRILPQIIYKGHSLRREPKAQEGLFFVVPDQVYQKILTRIGDELLEYPRGPGTVTFRTYALGDEQPDGTSPLVLVNEFTTSVEQIAFAFVSPRNLPEIETYQRKIEKTLGIERESEDNVAISFSFD